MVSVEQFYSSSSILFEIFGKLQGSTSFKLLLNNCLVIMISFFSMFQRSLESLRSDRSRNQGFKYSKPHPPDDRSEKKNKKATLVVSIS